MKLRSLKTSKSSLTAGKILEIGDMELFFDYETLCGVRTAAGCWYQRDGLAGSRTTARHIKLWLDGRKAECVSYPELLGKAGMEGC